MSKRIEKILFAVLFIGVVIIGGWRLFVGEASTPSNDDAPSQKDSLVSEISEAKAGEDSVAGVAASEKGKTSTEPTSVAENVTVYVGGAVQKPGLYTLSAEKRVQDALEMAGGLTKDGVLAAINPAQHLEDEMKIVVPAEKEATLSQSVVPDPVSVPSTGSKAAENQSTIHAKKININTATIEELQTLPSIGKAKAEAIVAYRQKKPFQSADEIMQVSGIGKKVFEKIRDRIVVR